MSKMLYFSVYDSKAECFKNPFPMRTKNEAIRAFSDVSNDQQTEIGKHPEDFTLFYLGSYDELTGKFCNESTPEPLGLAINFKKS